MSTAKQRAFDLLRERQKEFHVFTGGNLQMDFFIKQYQKNFPEEDWSRYCVRFELPNGDSTTEVYAKKPLVRWRSGDTKMVEEKLGVRLPEWLHEFYQEVECAVLSFLETVEILSPLQMVQAEMERREIVGEDETNSRLILFAEDDGSGDGFFAYQARDGEWRVIFGNSRGTDTAEADETPWKIDSGDRDIFEWLERMLSTDAFPMMKGYERFERCYGQKVGVLRLP